MLIGSQPSSAVSNLLGSRSASEPEADARPFLRGFSDPTAVAIYAECARRFVPGLDALHRMSAVLLAEHAPPHARVLVLGAGGGLELRVLAQVHPGWTFVGVDPASAMLAQARRTLGPLMTRVELVEGNIDAAPDDPSPPAARRAVRGRPCELPADGARAHALANALPRLRRRLGR